MIYRVRKKKQNDFSNSSIRMSVCTVCTQQSVPYVQFKDHIEGVKADRISFYFSYFVHWQTLYVVVV